MDALTTFEALVRLETRLWNDLDRVLLDAGHPGAAWLGVLRIVRATPDCRIGDVSRQLAVTHGGLSKLADRIVAAGLIERSADPRDRRASVLVLTVEGRSALDAAETAADSWLSARLAGAATPRSLDDHLVVVRTHLEDTP